MSISQNIHWTTDELLLAEYALGHLDAQQAAGLEEHLRGCDQCRLAVEAEQQLAAGVRRAGREALRRRLAQRLDRKRPGTSWYKVAGVAAAFVLLLTVGIYNDWFSGSETRLANSGMKSDSIAPKIEATPHAPQAEQQPEKRHLADVAVPSDAAGRDRAEVKGAGATRIEADEKKEEPVELKHDVAARSMSDGNIVIQKDRAYAAPIEPEGVWVDGSVVAEERTLRAAGKALEKNAEDVRENAPKGKKDAAVTMFQTAQSSSKSAGGSDVLVSQRLVQDLPRNQQRAKQVLSQVPTLFRSGSGGLSLVLYSDSILSRSDLNQARLQAISHDSLILQIGSQRIGYRLPPGLAGEMAKQLGRGK